MKFSIDKETFMGVLKRIDGVCPAKGSSFAALACCLIEARGDEIVVTGTDLELTLRVIVNANILEEGKAIIHAHQLLDTVQCQPQDVPILISREGSQTLIDAGNFHGRISNIDISDYPQVDNLDYQECVRINALEFKSLITKTMFSISRDDSRIDFTGAFLTVKQNGKIEMVSTDGHRLSRVESMSSIVGTLNKNFETGVILPKKALSEFSKYLTDGDIGLNCVGKKVIVSMGNTTYQITAIMGQFPDFSKVIPSKLDHKAIIRRDSFQQILKRAAIFANKVAGTIRLTMSAGKLEISAFDSQKGEMRDFIEAEYEGAGVTAGFNWSYISDILGVIDNEYVSLEIIDMDSPAVIRDITTDKLDFIVMPMQL